MSDKERQIEQSEKSIEDPFAQMIQFYDTFAKSWSNVMSDAVASKSFAESMGQQLEGSLDAMTMWRRQMGDWMERSLQQMSLPTRSQVADLGERLTNLEMMVDDMHAKLDEVLDTLQKKKK